MAAITHPLGVCEPSDIPNKRSVCLTHTPTVRKMWAHTLALSVLWTIPCKAAFRANSSVSVLQGFAARVIGIINMYVSVVLLCLNEIQL